MLISYKTIRTIILLVLISVFLAYTKCYAQKAYVSPKIKLYVDFIQQQNVSPVDYIMGLFEKYDVVILGERDHNDTTQYDLIEQILSDPRFIEHVGHVMTESGVYNMTDEINKVLKATYTNDSIFEDKLLRTCINVDHMPLWDATNFYQYLYSVYRINKNLPDDKKISITLSDVEFSWRDVPRNLTDSKEFDNKYSIMYKGNRDSLIGNNAVKALNKIFNSNTQRKKALIIYNFPHSGQVSHKIDNSNEYWYSAAQVIFNAFPGRVTNVMINWAARIKKTNKYTSLLQKGKWDAAFAACGNKSVGFNLSGSPFGKDKFDLLDYHYLKGKTYSDIFDGYIFYKPVEEWVISAGVPNLYKYEEFKDEIAWRVNVYMDTNMSKDDIWNNYVKLRNFDFGNRLPIEKVQKQIQKYYKPGTENGK